MYGTCNLYHQRETAESSSTQIQLSPENYLRRNFLGKILKILFNQLFFKWKYWINLHFNQKQIAQLLVKFSKTCMKQRKNTPENNFDSCSFNMVPEACVPNLAPAYLRTRLGPNGPRPLHIYSHTNRSYVSALHFFIPSTTDGNKSHPAKIWWVKLHTLWGSMIWQCHTKFTRKINHFLSPL